MQCTDEEWGKLCKEHTTAEIMAILCIGKASVSKQQTRTGIKPLRVCIDCSTRFTPVSTERLCPHCQKNKKYHYEATVKKKPYRGKPRKSKAFEIEKKMRKKGKNYAAYQKAQTVEEYARVRIGG